MTDNVNHPSHYTQGGVECIDAITAATVNKTGIEAVCTANVIKYLWRYEAKNGLEDVKKAQWYLNRLIAELEGSPVVPEPEKCAGRHIWGRQLRETDLRTCMVCGEVEGKPAVVPEECKHVFEATFTDPDSRCIICGVKEEDHL